MRKVIILVIFIGQIGLGFSCSWCPSICDDNNNIRGEPSKPKTAPDGSKFNGIAGLLENGKNEIKIPKTELTCKLTELPSLSDKMEYLSGVYPDTNPQVTRAEVTGDNLFWSKDWDEYSPPTYSAKIVPGISKPDPELGTEGFSPKFNAMDGVLNRQSYHGQYEVSSENVPRNIANIRTGMKGRGSLPFFAVNHVGDAIITKWKVGDDGTTVEEVKGKKILEFLGVKLGDITTKWRIPGGRPSDTNDDVIVVMKTGLKNLAFNYENLKDQAPSAVDTLVNKVIKDDGTGGECVSAGYVASAVTTDEAWYETVFVNYHVDEATAKDLKDLFHTGTAVAVDWVELKSSGEYHPGHMKALEQVANIHKARWSDQGDSS